MAKIERASVKSRPEKSAAKSSYDLNITKPGTGTHLKMVLFGPPKTGKTTAACSGSGRKLLILTEPDGDLPLIGREDIDVVRPEDGKELFEIVQALHGGAVENYDWVILDSVTFAFELVGAKAIAKVVEEGRDIRNVYGRVGASLSQVLHDLVALKTNVVFITQLRHDSADDDDVDSPGPEEGKFPFSPAVTPMVYKVLAPAVSILGRTYKKMFVGADGNRKSQFMVSFEDYGRSPAGSRIETPDTAENLNVDTLLEILQGGTN